MSICRWVDGAYLLRTHRNDCANRGCEGCTPCEADEHGNPVRHCEARRRCTGHLAWGEHVCPDCIGRIRRDMRATLDEMALMPTEAEHAGIDSAAATLAGPVANRVLASWRLINASRAGLDVEELDESDPYTALSLRERMIREDLGHDLDTLVSPTLAGVIDYLDRVLPVLARDSGQVLVVADLLATAARVRGRAESARHNDRKPEVGVECPACPSTEEKPAPRLRRQWAHWCADPYCEREHDTTGARDNWQCPADKTHWWSEADYRLWVSGDYLANADRLTATDMATAHGIPAGSVTAWASRGLVRKRGTDARGRMLYDVGDTLAVANDGAATS